MYYNFSNPSLQRSNTALKTRVLIPEIGTSISLACLYEELQWNAVIKEIVPKHSAILPVYLAMGFGSFLPDCSQEAIIVTTRNKQFALRFTLGSSQRTIAVDEMSDQEAIELLSQGLEQ